MGTNRKPIFSVGINDADYSTQSKANGVCKFYRTWVHILERCYDKKCQSKHPTYTGCQVSAEWLVFSNFKRWMESQDWVGNYIDKDILVKGNKIYSAENCVFVSRITNNFFIDAGAARGRFMIGVSWAEKCARFRAECSNPFTKKSEYLGLFDCEVEAHTAWKKRKHELALQLADLQTDERVAQSLRVRYL